MNVTAPAVTWSPPAAANSGYRSNHGSTTLDSTMSSIPARSPGGSGRARLPGEPLSQEDRATISALQKRDREVRAHEQAHLAAAAGISVSGPSYSFQQGPDGVRYAIGGNVRIDVSPGRTPEDTLTKARTIQAAALAPAQPSAQDLSVAARARQMELSALAELASQRQQEGSVDRAYRAGSAEASPDWRGNGIDTRA